MTEHAPLAPSSAHRWSHCAASVSLSRQYPSDDNDDGAEGTAAHETAAMMVRGIALDGAGASEVASNGVVITQEMCEDVRPFVDFVWSWNTLPTIEGRLDVPTIHPDCWGTPDARTLDYVKRVARIVDLKYGWGLVEAYQNPQLLTYAAGVADILGPDGIDWTYELTIVQPRAWHPSGVVRTWIVTGPELRNHVRHLRAMAEEAMSNDPSAHVGSWCKHCPARHGCKALRVASLDAVEQSNDATPLDLPPDALAVELAMLKRAQAALEARLSGLEADAIARIDGGAVVPGWAVDRPMGREEWTRPIAEVIALGQVFGVSIGKEPTAITPNQARKAGMPADAVAAISGRKPGTPKLVPVSTTDARRVFGSNGA